ncbi:MAG: relaxase domain-containing protein, partial [Euzebya sp.]
MRVMSAGTGYRYLLKSVVAGDGVRDLSTPLTRYYAEQGTPPGFWLGSGIAGLGDGQIRSGEVVTEEQLQSLLGEGRDPVSGIPLGRAFPQYQSRAERIEGRVAVLDAGLTGDERAVAVALIEVEESAGKVRRAVAGFD